MNIFHQRKSLCERFLYYSRSVVTWKNCQSHGTLSYHVESISGRIVRRHVDAIRVRTSLVPRPSSSTTSDYDSSDNDFLLPDLPLDLLLHYIPCYVVLLNNAYRQIDWVTKCCRLEGGSVMYCCHYCIFAMLIVMLCHVM